MSYTKRDLQQFNEKVATELDSFWQDRAIDRDSVSRKLRTDLGTEDILDVFRREKRIHLSAEAGEGKSVAVVSSADRILKGQVPTMDSVILMPLYRLMDHKVNSSQTLIEWMQANTPAKDSNPEFLTQLLHSSGTVVLMDGVDELASSSKRNEFGKGLNGLMVDFPEAQYLMVASRPLIHIPTVNQNFKKYEFEPLSDEEVERVMQTELERIYTNPANSRFMISSSLDEFKCTRKRVKGYEHLLRNPSYLRLAALMNGEVPKFAADFLKEGMNAYLSYAKDNPESKGLGNKLTSDKELTIGQILINIIPVLQEMAYNLHTSGHRAMKKSDLQALSSWSSVKRYDSQDHRILLPAEERSKLLELLTLTAPFFGISHLDSNTGEPHYYFTHLGIQEYLVGAELANQIGKEKLGKNEEIISPLLNDPWWRQPLVYAASNEGIAPMVLKAIRSTKDEKFMADAYLFGQGSMSLDEKLRTDLEKSYRKFYENKN